MPDRTTIFVSYSRRDLRWLQRLQVHLKPFVRRGDLDLWDDTKLDPGDRWRSSIRAAIDRAAASILLISADFLASDFVTSEELPPLLQKAARAGSTILPIVVQPCRLANHPELACFQALNPPDAPLSKLSEVEAEEVFVRAAEHVERLVCRREPASPSSPQAKARSDGSAGSKMFDDLHCATVSLAILVELARAGDSGTGYTLTDITRILDATSRKTAFDALAKLERAEWIVRCRTAGKIRYRIASEGIRQLARLAAVADGPLRSAVAMP